MQTYIRRIWACLRRTRLLYRSDSQLRSKGTLHQRIRRQITLPILYRLVDGFLTVGDSNRDSLPAIRRTGYPVRDVAAFAGHLHLWASNRDLYQRYSETSLRISRGPDLTVSLGAF